MTKVVEFLSFTATDEYLADGTRVSAPSQYVKKLEGFLKGFQGFAIEEPSQGYFVLIWDSFASFEAAEKREDFPAFLQTLRSTIMKDNVALRHVTFDEDTINALSAPVTEYSIVKPKDGRTQTEVDAIIASMKEAAPAVPGAHPPLAWGPTKQSPELYALAAGWDSAEAHMNALKVSPIDVLAPKLFEIADITSVFLTKYFFTLVQPKKGKKRDKENKRKTQVRSAKSGHQKSVDLAVIFPEKHVMAWECYVKKLKKG